MLIVFDVYGDCHNVLVGQKRNNNVKTITLYTKIDFPYSISSSVACECVRSLLYASRAHTSYHAGAAAAAAIFRNVCESVAAYRTLSLSIAFTNVFVCQWARKKITAHETAKLFESTITAKKSLNMNDNEEERRRG